jgi:hypothetical protein
VLCLLFGTVLSHRSDYLGHFAAGYGGSLGALTILLFISAALRREHVRSALLLVGVVACIGIGAIFESTVFRIARFDEVDFCNQSLGAALAGLAVFAMCPHGEPPGAAVGLSLISSALFLFAGFHYAFA